MLGSLLGEVPHKPSEKQWWVTGFDPYSQGYQPGDLTATFTVNFNDKGMYTDFYDKFGNQKSKDYDSRWTDWNAKTYSVVLNF